VPESLDKELCLVELEAPNPEELLAAVDHVAKGYPASRSPPPALADSTRLRGLTIMEAEHVMHRTFAGGVSKAEMLDEIFAEKRNLAKKAGFLEYIPVKFDVSKGAAGEREDWRLSANPSSIRSPSTPASRRLRAS